MERLADAGEKLPSEGALGVYRVSVPQREVHVFAEQRAPHRWMLHIEPSTLVGLKDARLQIDYRGDIGSLFLNDRMISDNFCNEDTWEVGLLEHREMLADASLVLAISPIREGAVVHTESAMAARNEEVQATVAELKTVRVQPVYEIKL